MNTEQIPDLAQECEGATTATCGCMRACGTITPASDSIERCINRSGCSLVLRTENRMRNVAEADSLNYVVQTVGKAIEFNFNTTVFSYYRLVYAFAPLQYRR
jgi:hypothetical protein